MGRIGHQHQAFIDIVNRVGLPREARPGPTAWPAAVIPTPGSEPRQMPHPKCRDWLVLRHRRPDNGHFVLSASGSKAKRTGIKKSLPAGVLMMRCQCHRAHDSALLVAPIARGHTRPLPHSRTRTIRPTVRGAQRSSHPRSEFPAGVSERHVRHGAPPPHLNPGWSLRIATAPAGSAGSQQCVQGRGALTSLASKPMRPLPWPSHTFMPV
ncbi:MAG: hypothetical protein CM15mP25_2620 [Gammaproteobacteria bacterium]|nr:MAG: hypothetical protein CM15mP25_2620 [Gammaproteobacteria bacterium]